MNFCVVNDLIHSLTDLLSWGVGLLSSCRGCGLMAGPMFSY